MASSHSLVAPQSLSKRTHHSRVLLASLLCVVLVLFSCGYYSYAPSSASTSLLLRDGIPNDREIEFESSV